MDVRARDQVVVTGREGGPVVVLAHGVGGDQHMLEPVVPALGQHFRVVVSDYVGGPP